MKIMKEFKEKKIVEILNMIVVIIGILFILSLILAIINYKFLLGFLLLPCCLPFIILSWYFSDINEYTDKFLKYIQFELKEATNLDSLYHIKKEFERLAIKDKKYCLSYPQVLRKIHAEILNKIDILEKFKQTFYYEKQDK